MKKSAETDTAETKLKAPKLAYPEDLYISIDEGEELFDERALDEPEPSFLDGVRALGVDTPVIVRRIKGAVAVPLYEVVDGRQRTNAARVVNAERAAHDPPLPPLKIKVTLKEAPLAVLLETKISANALRKGDPPCRRAREARRALDRGLTKPKLARAYGVTTKLVNNLLKLLDLAPEVQEAVDEAKITYSFAIKKLYRIPVEEQAEALEKLLESGTTRGAAADAAAEAMAKGKKVDVDEGKADEDEDGGSEEPKVERTRSRPFLESLALTLSRAKLKREAALVRFVLGKNTALRGSELADLREAATESGWAP